MTINHEQHTTHLGQQPRQLLRHEVERQLVSEVGQLLAHQPDEGLTWDSSQSDLIEALHVAFTTGMLADAEGNMMPFRSLVGRAASVLHFRPPRNPYQVASRAARRKGVQRTSFMRRYQLLLSHDVELPFLRHVKA